ncbi:MAG: calcium/sodium antiporter [Bacteroidota bacterium]|nr:calcium/sodium antiporter [Bacteroidota bacterium]MDX5446807.1 calcium/sodium antiporter [Bacteroidota bacterium]MDX5506369.1 calcium/sodium antiporter [Bacteroidota bacterium]
MEYLNVVAGLVLLVVAGEMLIRSSVSLALWLNVSTLVIGLTVVSFATSAPELLVSLQAAMNGHPDISVGNVVGSNIANIGLILGLTALIKRLPVMDRGYRFDWVIMVVVTLLFYLFVIWDDRLNGWEGGVLVMMIIGYNVYKIRGSRKARNADVMEKEIQESYVKRPLWMVFLLLLIGIVGLRYGAQFLVDGASEIALQLGVGERVISLTIVAFGTSVPELAASLIAARKGETDLAVGNIIGSNIFNITSVLGLSSMIIDIPLTSPEFLTFDYWWMLGFSLLLGVPIFFFTSKYLGKRLGGLFLGGYILYFYFLL